MFNLKGTPYVLDSDAESQVRERLGKIEERMALLRKQGSLSEETLKNYYGEKRFEQVAESNGIEGSTLSVGETQLAVLKGITITGHDPAYARDAIALDKALIRLTEFARLSKPTDIEQLQELHALVLGGRAGAGLFRKDRVQISGSPHTPPKTWELVMAGMEQWQSWSIENSELPAPIRAAVMHAWLTHIHPYLDGNGRTSRAIGNLELIRAGYPPIIIKKKERDRYIQALAESDLGGDIRSFIELILDKIDQSLTGLELSSKKMQGFDPVAIQMREMQQSALKVWTTSVDLLASMVEHQLRTLVQAAGGKVFLKRFEDPVDFEEYLELCNGRSIPRSWAFIISVSLPGQPQYDVLGYIGHRSAHLFHSYADVGGPSLYFSRKNPAGFPKWITDELSAHFLSEATIDSGKGDAWRIKNESGELENLTTNQVAVGVSRRIVERILSRSGA